MYFLAVRVCVRPDVSVTDDATGTDAPVDDADAGSRKRSAEAMSPTAAAAAAATAGRKRTNYTEDQRSLMRMVVNACGGSLHGAQKRISKIPGYEQLSRTVLRSYMSVGTARKRARVGDDGVSEPVGEFD